jgi:hypothetical protein
MKAGMVITHTPAGLVLSTDTGHSLTTPEAATTAPSSIGTWGQVNEVAATFWEPRRAYLSGESIGVDVEEVGAIVQRIERCRSH